MECIIQYYGNLTELKEKVGFEAEELLAGYAIVRISQSNFASLFSVKEIIWVELPRNIFYETEEGRRASCITPVQRENGLNLTGNGVLVAILDSGIDYAHPDFCTEEGTTRIVALWDQTLTPREGEAPPAGYFDGVLFDEAQINAALQESRFADRQQIVRSVDNSGHGTHVAGIACGNGRAGGRQYRGVAYESDILVVKIGGTQRDAFPQTTNLMAGIDFAVRFAMARNQPLVINISFGNNDGSHDGRSLFETYIDAVCLRGRNAIVIGTGNEANKRKHASGVLPSTQMNVGSRTTMQEKLLAVAEGEDLVRISIWKQFADQFDIILVTPSGERVTVSQEEGGETVVLSEVRVNSFTGGPTPYRSLQEITIELRAEGQSRFLRAGIFRLQFTPQDVRDGRYDIWLPLGGVSLATGFLQADVYGTITIPSTAYRAISVAAYDAETGSIVPFSGRGFEDGRRVQKPDVAAPGVNIVSCTPGGGYTAKTGTSMATPFVSGSAALLMEWGILRQNDRYLYGERLKAYLQKGAKPLVSITQYPNPILGWGTLCVEESIRRG